ncbi:MAG: hypothetical protein V7K89_19880 [Nostoc sp.]|uniref:hypothetical protein n=1 Tax=Nostoc sp. TaxID=1180 RepID=UPI002FFB7BAD
MLYGETALPRVVKAPTTGLGRQQEDKLYRFTNTAQTPTDTLRLRLTIAVKPR